MTTASKTLTEIRWHGRAGQGVVTAAELLAQTALRDGKYFQALPEFGAERTGAPIRAYTRISSEPILMHCGITEPDILMILDETLIGNVEMTDGLKNDGVVVANTTLSPAELRGILKLKPTHKIYTLDATRIAMESIGRNVTNVPMLGALLRARPLVGAEALVAAIRERLGSRVGAHVVAGNVKAYERASVEAQEG